MTVELFLDAGAELAEGPVWDDRTHELVWVDILRGEVHRTSEDGSNDGVIALGEHVGAVVLTEDNGMVAATTSGFRLVHGERHHPLLASLPGISHGIRMNDGKCDPAGRFVAGTMAYDETPGAGALYSFDGNNVKRLLSGVTISNGLAWSLDGRIMYYVDTPTGRIDAFDYDVDTGEIANRRLVVLLPHEVGKPDGLTIDADDGIWVALWDGGAVHRYEDGRLTQRISIPARRVTSCTLGGRGRDRLYVTTARDPESNIGGGIYVINDVTAGPPTCRASVFTDSHGTAGATT